jgi:hypothetical protein
LDQKTTVLFPTPKQIKNATKQKRVGAKSAAELKSVFITRIKKKSAKVNAKQRADASQFSNSNHCSLLINHQKAKDGMALEGDQKVKDM